MEKIDTGTDHLIFEKANGVALLTMNRPEARNAMSGEMNQAMQEVLAEVELDKEIRCVVLTGAGKGFCAGGDVKGMALQEMGQLGIIRLTRLFISKGFIKERHRANYLKCQNQLLLLFQEPQQEQDSLML